MFVTRHLGLPTLGELLKRGARNGARHATKGAGGWNAVFDPITRAGTRMAQGMGDTETGALRKCSVCLP